MTQETMTVHKALAELKLLDGRINKTITEGTYCIENKHSNDKINGVSIKGFEKVIQGSYDKARDLINRRKAIKRAVTLSNAQTKVTISGTEYTVAEAIEMKNHGILFEKNLVHTMLTQYNNAIIAIKENNGKELENRADSYVTALYGNKEGKSNSAEIEKTRKEFIINNSYELIDPINVLDEISLLEGYINDFMAEVDSALSVSNALTEITIEY